MAVETRSMKHSREERDHGGGDEGPKRSRVETRVSDFHMGSFEPTAGRQGRRPPRRPRPSATRGGARCRALKSVSLVLAIVSAGVLLYVALAPSGGAGLPWPL